MIPKTENEREFLGRIQRLETEQFGGTKEQNYSPREEAKSITDEDTNPHHIGEKSTQVLKQELESHMQNYQETFSKDEEREWYGKKQSLTNQLREATKP